MMHVVSSLKCFAGRGQAQITLCEAVAKVSKSHTVPIVNITAKKILVRFGCLSCNLVICTQIIHVGAAAMQ